MIFVQLTENDKRMIIVILLFLFLIFVIIGYLGKLIKRAMTFQANKMDDMVHDVIVTGVITDSNHLLKYGVKKNHRQLFKNSWIPVLIMSVSGLVMLIWCIIYDNWTINPFEWGEGIGFGTLLFHFDWDGAERANFFGVTLISNWPEVIHYPTWCWKAWGSYIFVPGSIVGAVWFLVDVQAYIARSYRLFKLSKSIFNKKLDKFDPNDLPRDPVKPE